ncbi:MAG TPA: metallophosphoesterase family protein [Thermoanaerobaculia bacterium]|nr:metallophosphoesterase family protein [Thermoanaerobaculia bacterium]
MRYLILSDMHGNQAALDAVLRRVRRKRFDATLVLGDLVGYGAAPNQVVETVRALPGRLVAVRGNHDKVAVGLDPGENFNHVALIAAQWTSRRLTRQNARHVRDLPRGPRGVDDGLAICHGSPLDEDKYLFSDQDAAEVFTSWDVPVTFFGHTHVTSVFTLEGRTVRVRQLTGAEGELELVPGNRYLVNPGSIGQPRDGDPRASYMTYDSGRRRVRWHRLEYPVERAQTRIRKAGLPDVLADRLAAGM